LVKRPSQATITIKRSTYEKLRKLKEALGYSTWNDMLTDIIRMLRDEIIRRRTE
jgi:predicted CopG family antitoxin